MEKVGNRRGWLHAIETQTRTRIPNWSLETMGGVAITSEAAT